MYTEDEYLQLSGIQHFVYCKRQWALIHIEKQWEENFRTTEGMILHRNAHDSDFTEKRGDTIITRAMAVSSPLLGISGECDVVEFRKNNNGIRIYGLEGKYSIVPIEYKRGKPKENECDIIQLTAQALCIEDMLCCQIPFGYLYYDEIKRRKKVVFDRSLRERTKEIIDHMHRLYKRRHTPKVKRTKACNACSLNSICLPVLCGNRSAAAYIKDMLKTED